MVDVAAPTYLYFEDLVTLNDPSAAIVDAEAPSPII